MPPPPSPSLSRVVRAARASLDPVALFEAGARVADPWQEEFMRDVASSLFNSSRLLLLCPRQVGKTESVAALCLWTAINHGGDILIVSPTQRTSANMISRIRQLNDAQPNPVKFIGESKLYLDLPNSRIITLGATSTSVRGFSARLIAVDEACHLGANDRELWQALSPCVAATKGSIIALSSAGLTGTYFHEQWENKDSAWNKTTITTDSCPRLTPEYLDNERRNLTEIQFACEYMNQFISADGGHALFNEDDLAAMFKDTEEASSLDKDRWASVFSIFDKPPAKDGD